MTELADHTSSDAVGAAASGHAATLDTMSRIFAGLFEIDEVLPSDSFFRLGGDSLMAETLLLEVERAFGISLSLSVMLEAATPDSLAHLVREEQQRRDSPLVTWRPTGKGPPIFCTHGLNGASLKLTRTLKTDSPMFGFRPLGLNPGERPLLDIRAIAVRNLGVLKQKAPAGPYLLMGHCAGATIAQEMARQLIAAGDIVAGLIMIDPESDWRSPFLHKSGLRLAATYLRLARRTRRFEQSLQLPPNATALQRRRAVERATDWGLRRYRPKPIACPALFFFTSERKAASMAPGRGYQTLLPNGEFMELDVEHSRMFTDRIDVIATAVDDFIGGLALSPAVAGELCAA